MSLPSTTKELRRYRVYCNTDSRYVNGFLNLTAGLPSVCFENASHSIDTSKTDLIEIIHNTYTPCVEHRKLTCAIDGTVYAFQASDSASTCPTNSSHTISATEVLEYIHNDKRVIKEPSKPMNGFFRVQTIMMDVLPNENKTEDLTWPFPIAPLSVIILPNELHRGDVYTVNVSPNKPVGVITANVSIGNTVLTVSATVIENIHVGFPCELFDGTNTEDLGFVVDKDYAAGTITVQHASTRAFLAATPTYVRMTVRFMGPHIIGRKGMMHFGTTKIGASYIPAGEIVRVNYENKSAHKKTIYGIVEYLY